jgi:hypothetical protein
LKYDDVGMDRWYDTGLLTVRSTDQFTWTNVTAQVGVYALPGNRNLQFNCPSRSTVRPGEILAVPFRECAKLLPADVDYAVLSSLHIQAREGGMQQAFEPGILIRTSSPH